MKQIQFLHLADLHFGRAFHSYRWMGEQVYDAMITQQKHAWMNAIDFAIKKPVDFVLICGDVFDYPNPSLQLQFFVKNELRRLGNIPVYIQHGNHDPYRDYGLQQLPNVHIFQSESVTHFIYEKSGEALAQIYGFSYLSEKVLERKIHSYQRSREGVFHIAMLHGANEGEMSHAPYAPFSLEEMLAANMDYYALGHIHKRQILHDEPPIVYSGSIIGLHKKELGPKGGVYVSMNEWETKVEFVDFAVVEWIEIEQDIAPYTSRMEWKEGVLELKER